MISSRSTRDCVVIALVVAVVGCETRAVRDNRDSAKSGAVKSDTIKSDAAAWTVSFNGLGPIQVGDPRSAVAARFGLGPAGTPGACEIVRIRDNARAVGVAVMIVRDSVARVDVDSSLVATQWGDRVGDAETAVLARHAGQVRVEPHKYTGPTGHYLIVSAAGDTLHRLVFETDGQRITRYRAGRRPEVDWVEGCS
jgi:hypothetical protein